MKKTKRRTRKHRRQNKAVMRNGSSAKRKHASPSGRKGKVMATNRKEKAVRL